MMKMELASACVCDVVLFQSNESIISALLMANINSNYKRADKLFGKLTGAIGRCVNRRDLSALPSERPTPIYSLSFFWFFAPKSVEEEVLFCSECLVKKT